MDAESQLIANLDAEIERLKALITELADALAEWTLGYPVKKELALMQRAREAVK